ncbi:MAG: hypothetical protein KF760_00140 [Candidatus Eremiobacteraeota bacterium]|nr:hypothetical protein [Candidatus Eremiobacteraeota bacterium]MCW5866628.1 hypothetical protein [Candidatus Eremiobacteraeota bacterium]
MNSLGHILNPNRRQPALELYQSSPTAFEAPPPLLCPVDRLDLGDCFVPEQPEQLRWLLQGLASNFA